MQTPIRIRNAHEHNLQGVDLDVPKGLWVAVTGPSGSGKTSLVFDTLVKEGQWRYLAGLSARARHFFGKLGHARVSALSSLPVPLAVGVHQSGGHARSTVGTLSGLLDLWRLYFARCAQDPDGEPVTRSHFSFNQEVGACEQCQGLGVMDSVDPDLLIGDPALSIRGGALVPTLKNGYTVYSQVTLEVMGEICAAHGFDVDTPWQQLSGEQRRVILYGTKRLKVAFGKHSIESRLKWEGITARPREEGYYRGLIPVIEETLKRNRNPNILRFVRSVPCSTCSGSRLGRVGREALIGDLSLPEVLSTPVQGWDTLATRLPESHVGQALIPELAARYRRLARLGLGHLTLQRGSLGLSGGEAQRLRLAAQLTAGLSGMLVALDEPTLGLAPEGQAGMAAVLNEFRDAGNSLIVVEHDPDMVRHADHVIAMGPGAGVHGGQVVYQGDPHEHPLGQVPSPKAKPRPGNGKVLRIQGACLHNLQAAELSVPQGTLHVVVGPSGAGKSSLVFQTLLPALNGQPAGPFGDLTGVPEGKVQAVDARPLGRTPRSTPATWSGLFDGVRKWFANSDDARERGWGAGRFSYNNKDGRCPTCEGLGVTRMGLHLLQDVEVPCEACGGSRYGPETLQVRRGGKNIGEVLAFSVSEALAFFETEPALHRLCAAMETLGLGYLSLGQPIHHLSRGESQRIKLATLLGAERVVPSILMLDEPDRGLHPSDVALLVRALDALVDQGHTVIAISHHRNLWAAADGKTLVRDGQTTPNPELDYAPLSQVGHVRKPAVIPDSIRLRGVATHNLRKVDVDLPHGQIIGLMGPSGSGKSSLAFDTLAAEAWRRFSESLPFQVRRFIRRLPKPELESAQGLTPTVALRQGDARAGRRSTVATQSEVGPLLRLLFARMGTLEGEPCGLTAGHFSAEQGLGACAHCSGLGTVARCDVDLLISHPERPLGQGAMGATRPGKFFGESDGQYMATLQAAGPEVDWSVPFQDLTPAARDLALQGSGDRSYHVTWNYSRGGRSGEHVFDGPWLGLCALVEQEAKRRVQSKAAAEWAAPLADQPCDACTGSGLRAEVARVRVGERTLPELMAMPLERVMSELRSMELKGAQREAMQSILASLEPRVADLCDLGLGHLQLDRSSQSLSEGELQRLRLIGVLRSGLSGMTVVLDEPSTGLHARDVQRLMARIQALQEAGNTVVVVSHRGQVLRAAQHGIELGPGAGSQGGNIEFQGAMESYWQGKGATAEALRRASRAPASRPSAETRMVFEGVHANNLAGWDASIPLNRVVAITGVSGCGKSSLLFDVVEASLSAGRPRGCHGL
ncbi:MAG: AAA family ATPase, partial [Planctomycetota bacterium]|nr:AAA family ATPase [Planctomycetota bacterium]